MARTLPTWQVEAAWSGQQTGVFRVGTSTIGGTDVLAGVFGNLVYDDLTTLTREFSVSRGRSGDMGAIEPGRCSLLVHDPDGTYNPENPTSQLAGYLDLYKALRIRASHDGADHGLFYGFITKIEHAPDWNQQATVIEAEDLLSTWLAAAKPTIASTGSTTVGAVIGLILDSIDWTETALRNLDTGSTIPDFSADGSKTALSLIQELLQVDLGLFFIDGDGVATYLSRDTRWARRDVDEDFSERVVADVRLGVDTQRLVNRQTVTREGGVAQTFAANDGKPFHDGSPITSPYLNSDTEALNLAQFRVLLQKNGLPRAQAVTFTGYDDTAITTQLTREFGDRVLFTDARSGTSLDGIIESVEHTFSGEAAQFTTTYLLTRRQVDAFTIGTSVINGADVLVY